MNNNALIHVDSKKRLFLVMTREGAFNCIVHFDAAVRDTAFIAAKLRRDDLRPLDAEFGTYASYLKYCRACNAWAQSAFSVDTWFTPGTHPEVQLVLEQYRHTGRMLRLFFGDPVTGRDYLEETNVFGRIERTDGMLKVPRLVPPRDGDVDGRVMWDHLSYCGERTHLDTRHILRILDVESRRDAYRAPTYQVPKLEMRGVSDPKMRANGLRCEVVDAGGTVQGRYPTVLRAAEHIEFLTGFLPVWRNTQQAYC